MRKSRNLLVAVLFSMCATVSYAQNTNRFADQQELLNERVLAALSGRQIGGGGSFSGITPGTSTNTAGIFTSAASYYNFRVDLTGGASSCPFTSIVGGPDTFGLSSCVTTPTSGVTNGFEVAVAGLVSVNDPNQGGLFGKVEGVGLYGVCKANANSTKCLGISPQVEGFSSGETGVFLEGMELGMIPSSTSDAGFGALASFEGANIQPTADNMPAFAVQTPSGTGTFTSGFECQRASIAIDASSFYKCLNLQPATNSTASSSQAVTFTATNSLGTAFSAELFGQLDANNHEQLAWTGGYVNAAGLMSGATIFTASGCSNTTLLGGSTAGSYHSGTTGTCTVTITLGGASGLASTNGWACRASDLTTPADVQNQTATTTTTATISGTTVSGDVINFSCIGY